MIPHIARDIIMFRNLIKRIQKHQMQRVAYWQLHNMSDKYLNDIGISRGDIRRVLED